MLRCPTATSASGKGTSACGRNATSVTPCSGLRSPLRRPSSSSSPVFVPGRPQMTQLAEQRAAPAASRKQIWILIGALLAPLALAFVLYYGLGIRPHGSTNKGDLIHPPVALPEVELPGMGDEKLAADALRGKWSVVYVGDGACDERCREALTLMRQTRLAL